MPRYTVPSKVLLLAALALAACGDDDDGGDGGSTTEEFITGVSATIEVPAVRAPASLRRMSNGKFLKPATVRRFAAALTPPVQVTAIYHTGNPPAAGNAATGEGTRNSNPLVGQPFRYLIEADGAFDQVYLQVEGMDGYWQLTLPSGLSDLELVITLANTPPNTDFVMRTLLGLPAGISQPLTLRVQPGDLSDASVVATVRWTGGPSDLDLHMLDGLDQHVYFSNPETPEGGSLDLDSNAGCATDNVNQEIISWPEGAAPNGEYTLWVQYYAACGVEQTNYNVTLQVSGRQEQTFQGNFTGAGDPSMTNPAFADTLAHFTLP